MILSPFPLRGNPRVPAKVLIPTRIKQSPSEQNEFSLNRAQGKGPRVYFQEAMGLHAKKSSEHIDLCRFTAHDIQNQCSLSLWSLEYKVGVLVLVAALMLHPWISSVGC